MCIHENTAGNNVTFQLCCHQFPHMDFTLWCIMEHIKYEENKYEFLIQCVETVMVLLYFNNLKCSVCNISTSYVHFKLFINIHVSFCGDIHYWTCDQCLLHKKTWTECKFLTVQEKLEVKPSRIPLKILLENKSHKNFHFC